MALSVVLGILVGTFYANHFSGNRLSIINSSGNKLNNLLHIVDDQYVDTINVNDLVEKAMPQILSELDPHSVYIGAKDVQIANDDLKGSFSGVGIEFTIRYDTVRVQNVIGNGPAERAGLIAGDKIVEVDDSPFVGKIVTNEEAMHRLKGPKDTKVKLGIMRYGEKTMRHITVTRGEIPTKSVTASYMLDDETGYIKIKNFGENTYPELLIALAKLSFLIWSSTCATTRAAIWLRPCRLPTSSSPRVSSSCIPKVASRRVRITVVTDEALISNCRWWFSSTRLLPLLLRSSQVPFRTTTVVPSSAVVRLVRAWFRSLWSSAITL